MIFLFAYRDAYKHLEQFHAISYLPTHQAHTVVKVLIFSHFSINGKIIVVLQMSFQCWQVICHFQVKHTVMS